MGINDIGQYREVGYYLRLVNKSCANNCITIHVFHLIGFTFISMTYILCQHKVQSSLVPIVTYCYYKFTSPLVVDFSTMCTPPGASFNASSMKSLGNRLWYFLTWKPPSCPWRAASFAVLTLLPNQASPHIPWLDLICCSLGIIFSNNQSMPPAVAPMISLN